MIDSLVWEAMIAFCDEAIILNVDNVKSEDSLAMFRCHDKIVHLNNNT